MGTRFYSANENAIEWIRGEGRITVTFSDPHFIKTIKRLAKRYPNEVEILALPSYNGGYICAHLPVSFLQIRSPGVQPQKTEDQLEELSNRMKTVNESRRKGDQRNS